MEREFDNINNINNIDDTVDGENNSVQTTNEEEYEDNTVLEDTTNNIDEQEKIDRNHRFAELRRQSEYKELSERIDNFAKQKGFNSFDEMEQAQSLERKNAFKEKFEQETGLDFEELRKAVIEIEKDNPNNQLLTQLANERMRSESERIFNDNLNKISNLIGSEIKGINDLMKLPNFEEFDRLARSGMDMVDAFKVSHFEYMNDTAYTRGKTSRLNTINAKSHLSPTKGAGASDINIPPDIIEEYKRFNPDVSEKEIKEHYARYLKEKEN